MKSKNRWSQHPLRALAGWSIGLTLAVLAAGCQDEASPAAAAPSPGEVPVRLERVEPHLISDTIVVPGLAEAKARIELSFRVPGFVERFAVEEGQHVAAGAVLAVLDTDDLERELRSARAALSRARARAGVARQQFERQKALLAESSTSQERWESARAEYEATGGAVREAQVALETAQERLARAQLRAPIDGWVERRLIEAHERVSPERPVLVLSDVDPIVVRGAVADFLLPRLELGMTVHVRSPIWPERFFEGVIRRIDVAADPATHTLPFEAEIGNADLALRPALAVEIEIPTGDPAPVLAVPLSAVLRGASAEPFCFVAGGSEGALRAERRRVAIGSVRGERVVIEEGLVAGDRIVTRGQHFLREGDALRVVE